MTTLIETIRSADMVGPAIVLCMVVLWYAIGVRTLTLAGVGNTLPDAALARVRSGRRPWTVYDSAVAALLAEANRRRTLKRGQLLAVVGPFRSALGVHADLVRSTAAIAPLLGLLGTVAGMIDMFGTISSGSEIGRHEGVASGIAEALTATELGLVVAVPGLLIGALLDRRQVSLETSLDAVVEHLVTTKLPAPVGEEV